MIGAVTNSLAKLHARAICAMDTPLFLASSATRSLMLWMEVSGLCRPRPLYPLRTTQYDTDGDLNRIGDIGGGAAESCQATVAGMTDRASRHWLQHKTGLNGFLGIPWDLLESLGDRLGRIGMNRVEWVELG